ncbi:hypothetical protein P1P75_41575 [Streptomyces sp. ID05-39B]|uniref:hypothetical protein n=1 Tax=Streptomyces sp. ID05-39B TaxID=3028664 RepID=UPI0029BC5D84|nr:hypothetical protein [Streptomyces sp. ID05-39B]MDX3532715.1 hypothetical protein [Streptomyces sp. ID05-39B]
MPAPPVPVRVLAALAALTAVAATLRHLHRLRRALDAERAARRLTDGQQHRDWEAFTIRLDAAVRAHRAVAEADQVLTDALTTHRDPEGGSHP